jgi:hypothetical protein
MSMHQWNDDRRQVLSCVGIERPSGLLAEIVDSMSVSYFGIVLGLVGICNAWRGGTRAWQLPEFMAEWIYLVAGIVWTALFVLNFFKALLQYATPAKRPQFLAVGILFATESTSAFESERSLCAGSGNSLYSACHSNEFQRARAA